MAALTLSPAHSYTECPCHSLVPFGATHLTDCGTHSPESFRSPRPLSCRAWQEATSLLVLSAHWAHCWELTPGTSGRAAPSSLPVLHQGLAACRVPPSHAFPVLCLLGSRVILEAGSRDNLSSGLIAFTAFLSQQPTSERSFPTKMYRIPPKD